MITCCASSPIPPLNSMAKGKRRDFSSYSSERAVDRPFRDHRQQKTSCIDLTPGERLSKHLFIQLIVPRDTFTHPNPFPQGSPCSQHRAAMLPPQRRKTVYQWWLARLFGRDWSPLFFADVRSHRPRFRDHESGIRPRCTSSCSC